MPNSSYSSDQKATLLLIFLVLLKVLLHCWVNLHDNFFRDEFYYMACGQHLDFGYVDHPPFVAVVAFITQALLGDSLFALRLPAVLVGALIVYLTGRLARELGGGLFAQGLAGLSMLLMPICLAITGYFSMNIFDYLFWLLSAYLLVALIKNDDQPRIWIILGMIMGIGLINKISMLFFGFGLFVGLILSPQRQWFKNKRLWITGLISFGIFLPHIIWQFSNDWPTLEFMNNARLYKNIALSPLQFIKDQIIMTHPSLTPIWLTGLFWLFFSNKGKRFRMLGWIYATVLPLMIIMKGKAYYLTPVYGMLFAAGAVCIENAIRRLGWNWLKPAVVIVVIIGGIIIAPLALPILSPEVFIAYSNKLGIKTSAEEKHDQGALPQSFADRQGWEEMVDAIGKVYQELPQVDQAKCVIIAGNYGEAGAIDYFGKKYDLPKAISSHNSYFLWGPGDKNGEIAISVGSSRNSLDKVFDNVQQATMIVHPLSMPYESNLPVYLCRQPKITLKEIWPQVKNYN